MLTNKYEINDLKFIGFRSLQVNYDLCVFK